MINKTIATIAAALMLSLSFVTPSSAGDREAEIITGIIGGIAGVIILDRALRNHRRDEHKYHNHYHNYHRHHREWEDHTKTYRCTNFPHGWDRSSYYTRCRRID